MKNKTAPSRNIKAPFLRVSVTILFSALTRMFPKPTFAP